MESSSINSCNFVYPVTCNRNEAYKFIGKTVVRALVDRDWEGGMEEWIEDEGGKDGKRRER